MISHGCGSDFVWSAVNRAGDWYGSPVNIANQSLAPHRPAPSGSPSLRAGQLVIELVSSGRSPKRVVLKGYAVRYCSMVHSDFPPGSYL